MHKYTWHNNTFFSMDDLWIKGTGAPWELEAGDFSVARDAAHTLLQIDHSRCCHQSGTSGATRKGPCPIPFSAHCEMPFGLWLWAGLGWGSSCLCCASAPSRPGFCSLLFRTRFLVLFWVHPTRLMMPLLDDDDVMFLWWWRHASCNTRGSCILGRVRHGYATKV